MTLIREHRGSLADSMRTVRECRDRAHLLEIITAEPYLDAIQNGQVHVKPYMYDRRIDWDTHLITVDGYGVWGMASGPIPIEPGDDYSI